MAEVLVEVKVVGVKETKEAIIGILELSVVLCEVLKDGAQASDIASIIAKLVTDGEIKAKIQQAVEGIQAAPGECKNITLAEIIEIVMAIVPYATRLSKALAK